MSRDPGLDFSFSGLKTALVYLCRELGPRASSERRADLAASFQAAAVGQLTAKLERALKRGEWEAVALGGGVAANGPLREAVAALCERRGVRLKLVAARALHRQRGDDRLRGSLRAAGFPTRTTSPTTPSPRRSRGAGVTVVTRLLAPRLPPLRGGDRGDRRPARRGLAVRAARGRHRERRAAAAARYLERIPVVEVDGERRLRAHPRRRRRCGRGSIL